MKILVTGGAGYIGSHTAKALALACHQPVVLDNLCHGHGWAVRWGPLVEADLSDRSALRRVFKKHRIEAVIHFAAFAYVGESMQIPAKYFRNNVVNTVNLLDAMQESGVKRIVFSSTCATYGQPRNTPMTEDHPQLPVSPYGESKLTVERMLGWYGVAYGLSWTALRYFNAAGADPDGEIGEVHDPETHLVPRAIAAAHGDLPEIEVFGADYDTPDGTAVRDYIHVTDLASAHVKAVEKLARGGPSGAFNLGSGIGHSVREVINLVERATGRKARVTLQPRRPGDPAVLVADASRAEQALDWKARDSSMERVVETACAWYCCSRRSAARETLRPVLARGAVAG
jgi:UDP-arabinose 4-epimerase